VSGACNIRLIVGEAHHDQAHKAICGGAAGGLCQQRLAELEMQMPSFIRADEDEGAGALFQQ